MNYTLKQADIVKKQIEALKVLYPELEEDAQLLADTIEGSTSLDDTLDRLVSFVLDAKAMAAAIKERKDALDDREKRYKRQSEAGRSMILGLMESAQVTRKTLVEATLSVKDGKSSVNITNVDDLPQGFVEIERKPLAKEIKAALDAGEAVPGAELKTGDKSLTVRVK